MRIGLALLAVAAVLGWLAPAPPSMAITRQIGGYQVLAGDFHLHSLPFDGATLMPWDVVIEARRRGLQVIALTGHNHTVTAKIGRWFSEVTGGPLVLVGEEIVTPPWDLIAVGIEDTVDWRGTIADAAAAIHRQGGWLSPRIH